MNTGDNEAQDANTEKLPLIANAAITNYSAPPASDLDEFNLKADLQQFSIADTVDTVEDISIAFPYDDKTMKSNIKKSELTEGA